MEVFSNPGSHWSLDPRFPSSASDIEATPRLQRRREKMNGVEAAASLFAPEETTGDPFASLGTNHSTDPFSPNGPSDFLQTISTKADRSDGQPTSLTEAFPSQPHEHPQGFYSYPSQPGAREWDEFGKRGFGLTQETELGDVSRAPAEVSHNSYAPASLQQYSQPSYNVSPPSHQYQPQLNLPLSSAIPSYGSYPTGQHVSQVNATAAPPPAASLEQPPLQLLPSLNAGHSTTNPYSVGSYVSHGRLTELPQPLPSLAPPPPPPPISSAINRPKVLNAYDPPFPPVSSNRRNGRAAVNQKTAGAYNTYHTFNQESEAQVRTSSTYTGEYGASRTLPPVQNAIRTETTPVYNHNRVAEAQAPRWDPVNQAVSEIGSPLAPENEPHGYRMFDQTRAAALPHKPDTYSTGENGYSTGYHHSTATQSATVPLDPHRGETLPVNSAHEATLERASLHLPQEQSTRSYSIKSDNSVFDDDPVVPTQYAHELHHNLSDAHSRPAVDDQRMGLPYQPYFPDEGISKGPMQITHDSYMHHSEVVGYNSFSSSTQNHDGTVDPYSPDAFQPPMDFTESSSAPSLHDAHVSKISLSYEGPSGLKSSSPSNSALNSLEDPYAPTHFQVHRETEYGLSTDPNYTSPTQNNLRKPMLTTTYGHHLPHDVAVAPPYTPYAPSPSLIGSNDPLARTTANIPIVSFGFGGRLVTCFHGADSLNTGFDVALSARNSTSLKIRGLKKFIPESVLDSPGGLYPGPLLSDPGTPTTSIVRTGMSTQTKTKKSRVIKYLDGRGNEIHQGIGYLTGMEKRKAEGKLVLVKLLKVMVEHDGKLVGTTQGDTAIRSALVPRLEGNPQGASLDVNGIPSQSYSSLMPDAHRVIPESSSQSNGPISTSNETISPTHKISVINRIEDFLLRGERYQAYQYALDEKLWPHAMIIASSIDKESWKAVVNQFLRDELGDSRNIDSLPFASSRENLRVAYSLFSGQGAAAVQELISTSVSHRSGLQPSAASLLAPNVSSTSAASFPESLSKWTETVSMILSNPMTVDSSGALTALGDLLFSNQWTEAAHVCYLLSPQTSPIGGIGSPSTRITLLGGKNPLTYPSFTKDADPFILSEILEFALSLVPVTKGQEPFHGLPHLQAYRFIQALSLAEMGDMQLANRYCEAITTSLVGGSPYYTTTFLEQLRGLSERIMGVSHAGKSASWIGGKLSKPSLDTIGGWLEGRFTKLVTGEGDASSTSEQETTKAESRPFSGPFAHYSTISSTTPSARSSPQPSLVDVNVLPPHRTASAMAAASPYMHPPIDRASSAMDYMRQRPSLGQHAPAANGLHSIPTGPGFRTHVPNNWSASSPDLLTPKSPIDSGENETPAEEPSWWGSGSTARTPTATTFMQVESSTARVSPDGFMSLMDSQSLAFGPLPPINSQGQRTQKVPDEDDDLGLGNSKRATGYNDRSTPASDSPGVEEQTQTSTSSESTSGRNQPTSVPSNAPATNGSWISRWWKGSESSPGTIKASLGEESAFYYDKEQKRWVNKKASGDETPKPSLPPPPPSRAQTASPGMGSTRHPISGPPTRAASAIDLSASPPSRGPIRVRSNLAPPAESAPSTPTGSRPPSGGPPIGRPTSQASKRNIRNRYVDVFQQGNGGS